MNAYLITWDESDGNDCTVYDTVITADSEDAALSTLSDALEAQMIANGTEWQDGGNYLDYMFNCAADCEEDCEGHGGTNLREVQCFATEEDARNAMSRWHREWSV